MTDAPLPRQLEQTFGCLVVPRFPLACELADRPELWGRPVVVAHPDAPVVWSTSPAASADGVTEGQRLSEALGRCPSLVVLDPRPARYEARDAAILDALERVVPRVEPVGLGTAYLDLTGLVRCYRSPDALHAALLACAPGDLRPRLGVGPTTFVARLAALKPRSRRDRRDVRVVAPAEVDTFVAPVPVAALPVDADVIRRLRLVGITTVGELAALPRRALVAQFGAEGTRLVGLLDGVAEPVRPRPREERLRERSAFPEPLTSREALLAAAAQLLRRVLRHPRRRGRVARQLVVRAETEQGKRWESTVTLRHARSDRDGVWTALAPVLERAALPGPVSELSVELGGLRPSRGWQGELLEARSGPRASPERHERIEEGLRQLRSRYGRSLVGRMIPVEPWSRVPERRWALVEVECWPEANADTGWRVGVGPE
jgi:nucleotidyltransferase/DNA polymerase involved in DNA repair